MKNKIKKFPESVIVNTSSRPDLHGYGVNRIYRITKDEAILISREFKLPTDFKKRNWDNEADYNFYYLNHAYGEKHIVYWLRKDGMPSQ